MKRGLIVAAVTGLLIAAGYGAGFLLYQPKIEFYQAQVYRLVSQISSLSEAVSSQEARIADQEKHISAQETRISELSQAVSAHQALISEQKSQFSALDAERSELQSDLAQAREALASYDQQVSTLAAQASSVQNRLDDILQTTVIQHYNWTYGGGSWQWDLPILLSAYVEYAERPRPESPAYWVDMAKDPLDDLYLDSMVKKINSAALTSGLGAVGKLNFTATFIQSLPYTVDNETTPYDEYPRYAVETLFDRGGDCEDTSILAAALLDKMGYDVALLLLENARHMAVGVSVSGVNGSYYLHNNKKYFYLETTGEGWQIGQIPASIIDRTARVYPLKG